MTIFFTTIWFLIICLSLAIGFYVGWPSAAGFLVGILIAFISFKAGALDRLETAVFWLVSRGWREQPPGEDRPRFFSEVFPVFLIVLSFLIVISVIVANVRSW